MTAITLNKRPVHRLPLADVVELVEQVRRPRRPSRAPGDALTLVERSRLARRQVADERPQALREVGLRRSGNVALHRPPR